MLSANPSTQFILSPQARSGQALPKGQGEKLCITETEFSMNLPHLSHATFRFTLQARDALLLPAYKGSVLRGGFGHAFRKVVCTMGPIPCDTCLLQSKCAYPQVFETPISGTPPPFMRGVKTGPQPFVLQPPLSEQSLTKPGESLSFDLVLIGRAIEILPYFIYTFDRLGDMGIGRGKGKFRLQSVAVWQGDWQEIYHVETQTLQAFQPVTPEPAAVPASLSELTLTFLSPTRIKAHGKLISEISFREIVLNLLRRVCTLAYFHMPDAEVDWDWKELLERANEVTVIESRLEWKDWERYSNRQKTRMKLGGFVGNLRLAGELKEWLPLLRLGEAVHIGKGATFGLGWYRIER